METACTKAGPWPSAAPTAPRERGDRGHAAEVDAQILDPQQRSTSATEWLDGWQYAETKHLTMDQIATTVGLALEDLQHDGEIPNHLEIQVTADTTEPLAVRRTVIRGLTPQDTTATRDDVMRAVFHLASHYNRIHLARPESCRFVYNVFAITAAEAPLAVLVGMTTDTLTTTYVLPDHHRKPRPPRPLGTRRADPPIVLERMIHRVPPKLVQSPVFPVDVRGICHGQRRPARCRLRASASCRFSRVRSRSLPPWVSRVRGDDRSTEQDSDEGNGGQIVAGTATSAIRSHPAPPHRDIGALWQTSSVVVDTHADVRVASRPAMGRRPRWRSHGPNGAGHYTPFRQFKRVAGS